jgi:hypothetical protein
MEASMGKSSTDIFDRSVAAIESEYIRLCHTLGWRFMMGPRATLTARASIGFITLNPGGKGISYDQPSESCENGNAYVTEVWSGGVPRAAALQRQVQMLFAALAAELEYKGSLQAFMDEEVMSAYFIPFRSPSMRTLHRAKESLEFATRLWTWIFDAWMPRCILTIGVDSFRAIVTILRGRPLARIIRTETFATGWANRQAESIELDGLRVDGPVTIARLPHLSRYQLLFLRDNAK